MSFPRAHPGGYWFLSLADARRTIESWRVSYNTARLHSALAFRTTAQFAQQFEVNNSTRLSA